MGSVLPEESRIRWTGLRGEPHGEDVESLRELLQELTQFGDDEAWSLARQVRDRIDASLARGSVDAASVEAVGEIEQPESAGLGIETARLEPEESLEDLRPLAPHQLKEYLIRHIDELDGLLRLRDELARRSPHGVEDLRRHVADCLGDFGVRVMWESDLVPGTVEEYSSVDSELTAGVGGVAGELPPAATEAAAHIPSECSEAADGEDASIDDQFTSVPGSPPSSAAVRGLSDLPVQLLRQPWTKLSIMTSSAVVAEKKPDWNWRQHAVDLATLAPDRDEYELHLAAAEWSIDPAILIRSEEDVQSRVQWATDFRPFAHQMNNLITFCRRAPVGLIADDVGLGKTISGGLILCELMKRGKVHRALVLAPKLLLEQWSEELRLKFNIDAGHAVAADLDFALHSGPAVIITTYDSARTRMDRLCDAGFDMIILDEAHKLRNLFPGTPPQIAEQLRDALAERAFHYVLMLTATPIQNRLWDLYSLIELLTVAKGHVNPLGSPEGFVRYFVGDGKSKARRLEAGRQTEFRRILGQHMVRTSRANCGLEFPSRQVRLLRAKPSPVESRLIDLVSRLISGLNALAQTSLAQALMSSPQALIDQLRRMEDNGTVPQGSADRAEEIAEFGEFPSKLRKLIELARQLRSERPADWRMLVFTGRKRTQQLIGHALAGEFGPDTAAFIQGGQPGMNQRAIRAYSSEPPTANVIVSTDAGAEGVNLQAGNVVVNYDLPWNPMVLEQRIGRVQRLGSNFGNVIVMNLVIAGSVEERIVGRLAEKLLAVSATLGDIEGILESMNRDGDGDESFEAMIRKMVVASLEGKDVEKAMSLMQESMDQAQRIYEAEKEVVDRHVGTLDSMHRDGPMAPELSLVEPRLSSEEFARRALEGEGARIEPKSTGLYRLKRAGYADRTITFDPRYDLESTERVIGRGGRPEIYAPGKQEFNQLTQRWMSRSGHHLRVLTATSVHSLQAKVEELLSSFGDAELVGISLSAGDTAFRGELVVSASTSVEHDKYDKLISVDVAPDHHDPINELKDAVVNSLDYALEDDVMIPVFDRVMSDSALHDSDISAFANYYLARRTEEIEHAGTEPRMRELASERFTPMVACRAIGLRGDVYQEAVAHIRFRLGGEGPYELDLPCVPVSGQVLRIPPLQRCAESGRQVPGSCLRRCDLSGELVLRHLLVKSERSGRLVRPSAAVRCGVTNRWLASDEAEASSVSGIRADRDLFANSAFSGARALKSELMACAFTGDSVLPDELFVSEVSGRPLRRDQTRVGGVDKQTGHYSEFRACAMSKDWMLPQELGKSEYSGRQVRLDLLVRSSEPPHRVGASDEVVTCAVSGEVVLSDEVETSVVSRIVARRTLMARSEKSGKWALQSEFEACAVSGRRLLRSEMGVCAVTGKRVDSDLLQKSAESGRFALQSEMKACEVSGAWVLLDELESCSVTGKSVLPRLLIKSAHSGRRALESEIVQSSLSGLPMLKEEAHQSSVSNRVALPSEFIACAWTGLELLEEEAETCAWTGLQFRPDELDQGVLRAARRVANTPGEQELPSSTLNALPGTPNFSLDRLLGVSAALSQSGQLVIAAGTTKGFLGIGRRRLVRAFRRGPGGWHVTGEVEIMEV